MSIQTFDCQAAWLTPMLLKAHMEKQWSCQHRTMIIFSQDRQNIFFHSFHWHMQNVTIPCHSQELLPFLSIMYFFLPSFSTNYSSILSHLILPSISWSTPQSCCSKIHIYYPFGNTIFFQSLYIPKPT